jgi:hypothetical protein
VLVVSAKGALQIINPEARRLLEVPAGAEKPELLATDV